MKYAIQASYYMYDSEKDQEYEEWMYLAVKGERRLFVFEEEVTDNTKVFTTAAEAGAYLDKHFGADAQRCCYSTVRIVEV